MISWPEWRLENKILNDLVPVLKVKNGFMATVKVRKENIENDEKDWGEWPTQIASLISVAHIFSLST